MAKVDEFKEANERYAASFGKGDLPTAPARRVAVVTCMDARLHPEKFFSLGVGGARIIRNAGGRGSEDAIRSPVISERLLGTDEIVVIHHTERGMLTFRNEDLAAKIKEDLGWMRRIATSSRYGQISRPTFSHFRTRSCYACAASGNIATQVTGWEETRDGYDADNSHRGGGSSLARPRGDTRGLEPQPVAATGGAA